MVQLLLFITSASASFCRAAALEVACETARKVRMRYVRLRTEESVGREIKRQELNPRLVVLVTKHARRVRRSRAYSALVGISGESLARNRFTK